MKLPLPWEPETGACAEWQRRMRNDLDARTARTQSGLELLVDFLAINARTWEEVAIEALKIAVNRLLVNNALDAINGGGVALRGQTRPFLAEQLFQPGEAVIQCRGEVSSRPARLAVADPARFEDDDVSARGTSLRAGPRRTS